MTEIPPCPRVCDFFAFSPSEEKFLYPSFTSRPDFQFVPASSGYLINSHNDFPQDEIGDLDTWQCLRRGCDFTEQSFSNACQRLKLVNIPHREIVEIDSRDLSTCTSSRYQLFRSTWFPSINIGPEDLNCIRFTVKVKVYDFSYCVVQKSLFSERVDIGDLDFKTTKCLR